jgi:hypothetical protein
MMGLCPLENYKIRAHNAVRQSRAAVVAPMRLHAPLRRLATRRTAAAAPQQELWIETTNSHVLTAAVESGHDTVLFPSGSDGAVRGAG